MSRPSDKKRARDRAWYARNRERHIANVLARRQDLKPPTVHKEGTLIENLEERIAYACEVVSRRFPKLWEQYRADSRQVATVAALSAKHTLDLSRTAQREAYALEKALGLHEPLKEMKNVI